MALWVGGCCLFLCIFSFCAVKQKTIQMRNRANVIHVEFFLLLTTSLASQRHVHYLSYEKIQKGGQQQEQQLTGLSSFLLQ